MIKDETSPLLSTLDLDSVKFYEPEVKLLKVQSLTKWHYWIVPCILIRFCSYAFYNSVILQYLNKHFERKFHQNMTKNKIFTNATYCDQNNTTEPHHHRTTVQKEADELFQIFLILGCIPAVFMNVITCALSDRYGRKLFIIISLLGTLLKTVFTAISVHLNLSIFYFVLFMSIESFTGGWYGVLALGFAYVSDLTPVDRSRTSAITLVEISVSLGVVLASITSGYLINSIGFVYAFVVLSSLNFLNILAMTVFLPDTVNETNSIKGSIPKLVKNVFTFYTLNTNGKKRKWKFILCVLIFLLFNFSLLSRQTIDKLYQLNFPFCWGINKIERYSQLSHVIRGVIGLASIRALQSCMTDNTMVFLSAISGFLAYLLEAFAFNDLMMFFVPVTGIFSMVVSPVLRSIMSKMAPQERQGAMFAGLAVVQTLCAVTVGIVAKAFHLSTVHVFRGSIFLLSAGYYLLIVILFTTFSAVKKSEKSKTVQ